MTSNRLFAITHFSAPTLKTGQRAAGSPYDGSQSGDVYWPNQGEVREFNFTELIDYLSTPITAAAKYLGPLFVGARLRDGRRGNQYVEAISVLSLDVEGGPTVEEAEEVFGEWAHIIYTSYNHTPEAHRFRVVLPLARDVSVTEYPHLWIWAAARLGTGVDHQASDVSRAMFLPVEGKHLVSRIWDEGPLLDPDVQLAKAASAQAARPANSSQHKKTPLRDPTVVFAGIPEGERDTTLFRYIWGLWVRNVGQPEATALAEIAAARCQPPFDREEAIRKVERIYSYCQQGEVSSTPQEALESLDEYLSALSEAKDSAGRHTALAGLLENDDFKATLGLVYLNEQSIIDARFERLQAQRGLGQVVSKLRSLAKKAARDMDAQRRRSQLRLASDTESAPALERVLQDLLVEHSLPAGLRCPAGWQITAEDTQAIRVSKDGQTSAVPIAPCPVLITGRLTDIHDGTVSLRLEWCRDGRWLHRVVSRAQVMDSRSIVPLADIDFPVHSGSARELVHFLADFEAVNSEHLPTARVSSQMGWQGEKGKYGFLWGRTLLREDGTIEGTKSIAELPPAQWMPDWIHLHVDGGGAQLAEGFRQSGTWAGWHGTLLRVRDTPAVMLALYAALAPPLMLLVPEAPNFILDWSGPTSMGKTTTLRVAASVWGYPDEHGLIGSWDATRVWIERSCATLGSLPLILDDTKRARKTSVISQTLYDVAHGLGRGRGNRQGTERTGQWRTVLLSTGEAPATSFSQDGGARARTLAFWGSPFGAVTAESAELTRQLRRDLLDHHGHMGPRFIHSLLQNRAQWPAIRKSYREKVAFWEAKAGTNAVASRVASYIGLLDLVQEYGRNFVDLPSPSVTSPLDYAWEAALEASEIADRATQALQDAYSWAVRYQETFWGRHTIDNQGAAKSPHGGWRGAWKKDDSAYLAFDRVALGDFLREQGYDQEAILRTWLDRGWLHHDPDRLTRRVRIVGVQVRAIAVTAEALRELEA